MMPREVAWRLFADELNAALPMATGSEEYSPNYVLTPLGA
ncbi:MAG TPA: DNA-binding protein, partial [Thermoplasmata archaeon]|nr:DNA-binding protein [Thermoplasmata archaeon]